MNIGKAMSSVQLAGPKRSVDRGLLSAACARLFLAPDFPRLLGAYPGTHVDYVKGRHVGTLTVVEKAIRRRPVELGEALVLDVGGNPAAALPTTKPRVAWTTRFSAPNWKGKKDADVGLPRPTKPTGSRRSTRPARHIRKPDAPSTSTGGEATTGGDLPSAPSPSPFSTRDPP